MYFLPRTNTLCAFFAPVPSLYRYAITSLFLTFVVAIWYCGIYCRIAHAMATNSQAMSSSFAHNNTGLITQSESMLAALFEQSRQALHDYNKIWKTSGIELILNAITKSGLRFVSSDIATKKNMTLGDKKGQLCVQDTITVQAVGTLRQCGQFFTLIAASGVDFTCQKIDLAATENNQYALSCVLKVVMTDYSKLGQV